MVTLLLSIVNIESLKVPYMVGHDFNDNKTETEYPSENNEFVGSTHWYNLINPDVIKVSVYNYNGTVNAPYITSYGRTVILYEFTVEGFRKALNCSDGENHIFIDLPDRTM
ncbi:unnamed protein product, partial [marine sediment metagenome]